MQLEPSTPEPQNWVYQDLKGEDLHLIPIEGYSVKGRVITALFERRVSSEAVSSWTEDSVTKWFEQKEDLTPWIARKNMANLLDVPLYLLLWNEHAEEFRGFTVEFSPSDRIRIVDKYMFKSCLDLAEWLGELKGISVSKGFVEYHRLSSLDRCLRRHGVPWPGNLDGFLPDTKIKKVKAIFEFSRTRKYPVSTHNLNRYFYQDINRWKPLDILSEQLDVPLIILIWSSDESIVKLQSVEEVTKTGLEFDHEDILNIDQLTEYLRSL